MTQRETDAWAAAFGDLYVPSLTVPLALVHAFARPWSRPAELRVINRVSHWIFWLDTILETEPVAAFDDIALRCTADTPAGLRMASDPLAESLADIRDELAESPLWPALGRFWKELVAETIAGMRSERDFVRQLVDGGAGPTVDEYLRAAGGGVRLARVSQWISLADPSVTDHLDALLEITREFEIAMRLSNDLHTCSRERRYEEPGDINVLFLGVTRERAARSMGERIAHCRALLEPLIAARVDAASVMDRYLALVPSFYAGADFRAFGHAPGVAR